MMNTLGQLTKIPLRQLWEHEERDFTPWLAKAENIAKLGASIGLELEVESVEKEVGPYSADILAKEIGSDRYVVIENQFGKTNHDHLGKLLTYGSGLNAGAIIWICETFTEEHEKALDWLNEHTTDELEFYGVAVELWQIDGSRPAVRFNVISRPNEAVRIANVWKDSGELSDTRKLQLEFWTAFGQKLLKDKIVASTHKPRPRYWFNVPMGRAGVYLSNIASPSENRIGVRIYMQNMIARAALSQLKSQREQIEAELEGKLMWDPNPNARDKIISLSIDADLSNREKWDEYLNWMVTKVRRFQEVFGPRIKKLDLSHDTVDDGSGESEEPTIST